MQVKPIAVCGWKWFYQQLQSLHAAGDGLISPPACSPSCSPASRLPPLAPRRYGTGGLLQAHYNSSKAAVIHMSKSLAMEWSTRGVRVNTISPGYTATPMNTRPEMVHQTKLFEEQTPMGRMASVDEMVGPAVFLLSDAASFVTGVDLLVDGGFCCW